MFEECLREMFGDATYLGKDGEIHKVFVGEIPPATCSGREVPAVRRDGACNAFKSSGCWRGCLKCIWMASSMC